MTFVRYPAEVVGGAAAFELTRFLEGHHATQFFRDRIRDKDRLEDVLEAVDGLRQAGRAWREAVEPADVGRSAYRSPVEAHTSPTMTTTEAASVLGITDRAVRGRCERQTLTSEMSGGVWLIDAADVLSMAEKASAA